jgi:hypothetical protein
MMTRYYNEEHRLMEDSGDGFQRIIAMCYDTDTAENLAKCLNMKDEIRFGLDNDCDVGSEFLEKLLEGTT